MNKRQLLWRGGAILGLVAAPVAMSASPASAAHKSVPADLRINKTCSPGTATLVPGDSVSCTLMVTNLGPNEAYDLIVTDDVGSGLTVVSASGGGFACSIANNSNPEVTCTRFSLGVGLTRTITVVATVDGDVGPNKALTDTAKVDAANPDPNPANDIDTATVNTVACTIDRRNDSSGQTITGTEGKDVICGSAFGDIIDGLGGSDIIFGLGGDDVINGGAGNDRIFGGAGDDILNGDAGDDRLFGGAGNDILEGNAGFDRLAGDSGVDACTGEVETTCED